MNFLIEVETDFLQDFFVLNVPYLFSGGFSVLKITVENHSTKTVKTGKGRMSFDDKVLVNLLNQGIAMCKIYISCRKVIFICFYSS